MSLRTLPSHKVLYPLQGICLKTLAYRATQENKGRLSAKYLKLLSTAKELVSEQRDIQGDSKYTSYRLRKFNSELM